MSKTEKQIRLCMRIMHRLVRRWYEEQGDTRDIKDKYANIKQYGSLIVGFYDNINKPVCNLTLHPRSKIGNHFVDWYEDMNVV